MTSAPTAYAERRVSAPDPAPRIGPLGRLARLTYRNRGRTLLAWLAVLVLAVVLSSAFGGKFKADYSAPGSDSAAAPNWPAWCTPKPKARSASAQAR